jgi:cell division protein FtsQ
VTWKGRALVLLLAGVAAIVGIRPLLRQLDFFRVRQVELLGVRYLSPDAVIAALELDSSVNLFEDLAAAEEQARALFAVADVKMERRLPGTLRVIVTERVPVAFAQGPSGLVALDADAKPLPYDPALSGLDLPIVERADSQLVAALATLRMVDWDLYHELDGARFDARHGITLVLGAQRFLFPGVPSADDITALSAVRRHLMSTDTHFEELDMRFGGWVTVRRPQA